VVPVNDVSVCPWSLFNEPLRSEIQSKPGPKPMSAFDGSLPGWPSQGYGGRM